jgi:hypothetical protein
VPSPREIALQKNDRSKFKEPTGYSPKDGCPTECVPDGKYVEWGKNPFRESGTEQQAPNPGQEG